MIVLLLKYLYYLIKLTALIPSLYLVRFLKNKNKAFIIICIEAIIILTLSFIIINDLDLFSIIIKYLNGNNEFILDRSFDMIKFGAGLFGANLIMCTFIKKDKISKTISIISLLIILASAILLIIDLPFIFQ